MDLTFTPEEQTFREDIRDWVKASLPQDISNQVHNALRLSRDDQQRWAKILGKKAGWVTAGRKSLVARAGTRFKSICLKKSVRWPVRPAWCRLARSW